MKPQGYEIKSGSGFAIVDKAAAANGHRPTIQGYLTVWNEVDQGNDRTIKGSFRSTIEKNPNPPLLWSHSTQALPLGKITRMVETDTGVFFTAALSGSSMARDVLALVKDGALTGVSYGYTAPKVRYVQDPGGSKTVRELLAIDCWEISLVNYPMLKSARLGGAPGSPLSDALLIDEVDVAVRDGAKLAGLPRWKVKAYFSARTRQLERISFDGRTKDEFFRDIIRSLALEVK